MPPLLVQLKKLHSHVQVTVHQEGGEWGTNWKEAEARSIEGGRVLQVNQLRVETSITSPSRTNYCDTGTVLPYPRHFVTVNQVFKMSSDGYKVAAVATGCVVSAAIGYLLAVRLHAAKPQTVLRKTVVQKLEQVQKGEGNHTHNQPQQSQQPQ